MSTKEVKLVYHGIYENSERAYFYFPSSKDLTRQGCFTSRILHTLVDREEISGATDGGTLLIPRGLL